MNLFRVPGIRNCPHGILSELGWTGFQDYHDWRENSPDGKAGRGGFHSSFFILRYSLFTCERSESLSEPRPVPEPVEGHDYGIGMIIFPSSLHFYRRDMIKNRSNIIKLRSDITISRETSHIMRGNITIFRSDMIIIRSDITINREE